MPSEFSSVSVPGVVVRALGRPKVAASALRFVGTVLKDFFGLQFAVRLGLRKVPVLNVDHPLDAKVPFRPDSIATYLGFIAFWIRPLGWIARHHGPRAFTEHAVAYLTLIDRCYREAADVYRAGMTTTRRPRYYRGRFLAIHLLDPHLLCVPSLHVMICVLTYTYYRRAFTSLGVPDAQRAALDDELFAQAAAITDSVLLIKQHSVNCVPAALYAMSRITPADVTPDEVARFIACLLTDEDPDGEIRTYISDAFAQLRADDAPTWTTTVQRFITKVGSPD